jgi:hypothetical protein
LSFIDRNHILFIIDKISQAGKVGQMQHPEYALARISIPSWAYGVSLVNVPLIITMSIIDKISQAENVGQMQHPEYALESASLVEPMV